MARRIVKEVKAEVNYKMGTDDKGNDIIKKASFSNIDKQASDNAILKFEKAIAEVLNYSATSYEVRENSSISNSDV